MSYNYDTHVFYRPGLNLPTAEQKRELQVDLCSLGRKCLRPLPCYQVFETTSPTALDDKLIVTIRVESQLIGFVSAVLISIVGLEAPVMHSGITIIHPKHQKSSVKRLLFGNLFMAVLAEYPQGLWTTTLAEVITSLVHYSQYITNVFPSPQWFEDHGTSSPSDVHLTIARQISANHRSKMCISPAAEFDELKFVFLGSNNWNGGRSFMKDGDDSQRWDRNHEASHFFRKLLRKEAGDEVLQVGFLTLPALLAAMKKEGFVKTESGVVAKKYDEESR